MSTRSERDLCQIINPTDQILLEAFQFDLVHDAGHLQQVDIPAVVIPACEAATFLRWIDSVWRETYLNDLQSLATDGTGRKMLTSTIALRVLREDLCTRRSGLDENTLSLLLRIRTEMRHWRDQGIDTVVISGYSVEASTRHSQEVSEVTDEPASDEHQARRMCYARKLDYSIFALTIITAVALANQLFLSGPAWDELINRIPHVISLVAVLGMCGAMHMMGFLERAAGRAPHQASKPNSSEGKGC